MSKQEGGLYALLEARLKKAKHPLTAATLYDDPAVQQLAGSSNRVSDYLANLWRKGRATRCAAPPGDGARFAYGYRERTHLDQHHYPVGQVAPEAGVLLARPELTISEKHDAITIDLPQFSITIKKRL